MREKDESGGDRLRKEQDRRSDFHEGTRSPSVPYAIDQAAELGFSLAAGAADQLGQAIPFFALRVALREPFVGLTAGVPGRDGADAAWWMTRIRIDLEQRAATGPLVCLDDLHWASAATLGAAAGPETVPGRVAFGQVAHPSASAEQSSPGTADRSTRGLNCCAMRHDMAEGFPRRARCPAVARARGRLDRPAPTR